MPIYEYRCTACNKETETLQKITDPLLVTCPHCNQDTLKKVVSSTTFQLKGSGWYVTDFRDKKKPNPAEDSSTGKKESSENKKEKVTTTAEPAKNKDKSKKSE